MILYKSSIHLFNQSLSCRMYFQPNKTMFIFQGQNKFQDLLSAALSESGLEEDLNDAAANNLQNDIVNISSNVLAPATGAVSYVPVHNVVQSPRTVITRLPPANVPCSVVRLPTPTTRVRTVTPNATNAGVKRIIVRAVVPQSLAGRRVNVPLSGQMVNIAGSTGGAQRLPGNIRVIRIPMSSGSKMVTLPLSTKSGSKIVVPASSLSGQMTGAPKIVTFGSATNSAASKQVVPVNFPNAVTSSSKSAITQVLLSHGGVATSLRNVTAGTHNHIAVVTQGSNVSSIVRLVSASATSTTPSSANQVPRTMCLTVPTTVRHGATPSAASSRVQHMVRVTSRTPQEKLVLTNMEQSVPSTNVVTVARLTNPIATRLDTTNTTTNAVLAATRTPSEVGRLGSNLVSCDRTVSVSNTLSAIHVTENVTSTALTSVTHPIVTSTDVTCAVTADGGINPAVTVCQGLTTVVASNDSVAHSESIATSATETIPVDSTAGTSSGNDEEKPVEVRLHRRGSSQ